MYCDGGILGFIVSRFYCNFVSVCRGVCGCVRGCVEGVSRVYHSFFRVCKWRGLSN